MLPTCLKNILQICVRLCKLRYLKTCTSRHKKNNMCSHFSWECEWHFSQVDDELPRYFVHLDLLANGLMPPYLGISSTLQSGRGAVMWECGVRKRDVAVPKKGNRVRKRGNQTPIWTMPLPKTFLWRPVSKEVGYFFDIDEDVKLMTWHGYH